MKHQWTKYLCVLAGVSVLTMTSALAASHETSKSGPGATIFNLEAVTCWEVITLPDEAESDALLLLYGYNAGKLRKANASADLIESNLVNLVDYCEEHPEVPALQAITKAQG